MLDFLPLFLLYFFADDLNANNEKILCSNSENSNLIAYDTNQSHLIQITSSSSLQITNLNDLAIKQLSKRAKSRSKFSKAKKRKRHRKK